MVEVEFQGSSMDPILRSGARLRCSCERQPALGDIVVFQADGHLIAHRVIGWRGSSSGRELLLAGDNRSLQDPPVQAAQCLGVVEAINYQGRHLDCTRPFVRATFRALAVANRISARGGASDGTDWEGPTRPGLLRRLLGHLVHRLLLLIAWGREQTNGT